MPAKRTKKTEHPPLPFVSVCTPTFNRRPFLPTMLECFRRQDYPKDRIEWIIVDDGTDCVRDVIEFADIPQIKYFYVPEKMLLGKKRNFIHSKCQGDILVYMDDDDYYPPERISHAVDMLMKNPQALCAGTSEIYVYFNPEPNSTGEPLMIQFGPYGPKHATAGTFAFRRELLIMTKYNDDKALAEEKEFLKEYTIPFVQLDPLKTILVFSHNHNSFNKRRLLTQTNPQFMKQSNKRVEDFIRRPEEQATRLFFTRQVDGLLEKYEPGKPENKPDVAIQMKEMEIERQKAMEKMIQQYQQQYQQQQQQTIYLEQPGMPPVALTPPQIVEIIQKQNQTIQQQAQLIQDLQQNKIILQRNPHEGPLALTHLQIAEFIAQQQRMIEMLKQKLLEARE